ncbi:hypothetical protein L873DRAFT_1673936 [Choiromyces venosus 120613-1]|uniref:Mitochondrial distribution and morphology protein 34 n=1 Tax=Choiromyces venosus 120613-1 TaxID=1336337 RepID=A0A3N4JYU6_9PEZI|nr:hypothetical protein L873DRAFT_1673936 [Choiromyces venosus 120613-1]
MAFNFNWTPLTTSNTSSSAFYSHAKSLLTAALNKSQKPPIIVDDIFVEELNLGQSAPELEILEIGDLAEDRFRGIFRMSYDGDAFLTLRTKVQANPLNTYLSTTPSYTSPMPLAASSPLTIPLQITLSQFRLSGFIILVFSKAKGITLVFRNDPLESLKVSSTFDTIPFIKDYLQKEIERQVRGLFQEELPVAVHRLSLRLWNPEYAASLGLDVHDPDPSSPIDGSEDGSGDDAKAAFTNPLLSPSDNSDTPSIVFSQKNLAALKGLSESQKTLSMRTLDIPDAVFRAWASGGGSSSTGWEKNGDVPSTPIGPQTYTFSDSGEATSSAASISSSRPSLAPSSSSMSLGGGTSTPSTRTRGKKKKHRVVNLRPTKESSDSDPAANKPTSLPTQTTTSSSSPAGQKEEDLPTPRAPTFPTPPQPQLIPSTPTTSAFSQEQKIVFESPVSPTSSIATENITYPPTSPSHHRPQLRAALANPSGILEQAFVKKLAHEMQKRIEEERMKRGVMGGANRKMWCEVERELAGVGLGIGMGMGMGMAPPAYRQ